MKSNFDLWLPAKEKESVQSQNDNVASFQSQSQMQTDINGVNNMSSTKSRGMSVDSDFSSWENKSPLLLPDATNDLFGSNLQSNISDDNNNNKMAQESWNSSQVEENKKKSFFQKAKQFISQSDNNNNNNNTKNEASNKQNQIQNNDNSNMIHNFDGEFSVSVSEDSISYNHQSPCPFGCKHCGASFDDIMALKNHLLNGHCKQESSVEHSASSSTYTPATSTLDRKKRYQCLLCGRGFEYRWILRRHMKVHTGEKEFACQVCGKKFRHKSNVKVHMVKHSNASKITCHICGKEFKWKASYKRHKCFQHSK